MSLYQAKPKTSLSYGILHACNEAQLDELYKAGSRADKMFITRWRNEKAGKFKHDSSAQVRAKIINRSLGALHFAKHALGGNAETLRQEIKRCNGIGEEAFQERARLAAASGAFVMIQGEIEWAINTLRSINGSAKKGKTK